MFLDLSNEIIYLIAQELDQNDRHALILTCHRLYAVTLPFLYSDITLRCNSKTYSLGHAGRLFFTLARQPHLASAVRSLRIEAWENEEDANFGYSSEYDDDLQKTIKDTHWQEQPIEQLSKGNTDAWLALLIPQLKGLRKISLRCPTNTRHVSRMLTEAAEQNPTPFPHLHEAFVDFHNPEVPNHACFLDPFFKFPTMRKIGGSALEHECRCKSTMPRSSEVVDLDLENAAFESGFTYWIAGCKALKIFRLRVASVVSLELDFEEDVLGYSLALHKDTLQGLWLCGEATAHNRDRGGFLGSFAEFSALKYLHISVTLLFAGSTRPTRDLVSLLPPSLETLYLCHCYNELFGWAMEQIVDLELSHSLPRVTLLGLEGYERSLGGFDMSLSTKIKLSEMERGAAERGVVFEVVYKEERTMPSSFLSRWSGLIGD